MVRLLPVCAALTLMVGCTRYQGAQVIMSVGFTGTIVGGGMFAEASDPEEAIAVVTYILLPSVALLVGGLIAMKVVPEQYAAQRRREETARAEAARAEAHEAVVARNERAWALTKAARAAQLAHDCVRVIALDREVRASDPEFHATVFARDVAIQRCLAVATPPTR